MDVTGLVDMVTGLKPEATLVYHPGGDRPSKMAEHLIKVGCPAVALSELDR